MHHNVQPIEYELLTILLRPDLPLSVQYYHTNRVRFLKFLSATQKRNCNAIKKNT